VGVDDDEYNVGVSIGGYVGDTYGVGGDGIGSGVAVGCYIVAANVGVNVGAACGGGGDVVYACGVGACRHVVVMMTVVTTSLAAWFGVDGGVCICVHRWR